MLILTVIRGTQARTPIKEIISKCTEFNSDTFGCYLQLCSQTAQFWEYHHQKALQSEKYIGDTLYFTEHFCISHSQLGDW